MMSQKLASLSPSSPTGALNTAVSLCSISCSLLAFWSNFSSLSINAVGIEVVVVSPVESGTAGGEGVEPAGVSDDVEEEGIDQDSHLVRGSFGNEGGGSCNKR